jgi:tripartite-type tricarboxylate transporter receptor subunit TctC
MALAGTPGGIVERVRQTLEEVLADPEVAEKLATLGTYPRPMSPAETAEFIRVEQELWRPVVREVGMSSQ